MNEALVQNNLFKEMGNVIRVYYRVTNHFTLGVYTSYQQNGWLWRLIFSLVLSRNVEGDIVICGIFFRSFVGGD